MNVSSDGVDLGFVELTATLWWHGSGRFFRLGNPLRHRLRDESQAAVTVQPLLVGQVRAETSNAFPCRPVTDVTQCGADLAMENAVA